MDIFWPVVSIHISETAASLSDPAALSPGLGLEEGGGREPTSVLTVYDLPSHWAWKPPAQSETPERPSGLKLSFHK